MLRSESGRDQWLQPAAGLRVGGIEPASHHPVLLDRLEGNLPVAARHEHAGEGVVVFVGNGVELVVVAAGTAHGQPEKRLAEGVDAVVHPVGLVLRNVDRPMHRLAQKPESRADDRLVRAGLRIDPWPFDEIAGNLLADELVVGQVVVERLHDPVAILPGVGDPIIELVSPRLAIPRHVEPVPREPLAIVGRGEELVDVVVEGMRVGIRSHPCDVSGKSRKAGEDLGRSTHEHLTGGFCRRLEPSRLEPREHEAIDVAGAPGGVFDRRRWRDAGRMPAPVLSLPLRNVEGLDAGLRGACWLAIIRPWQPATDPFLDGLDRRRRQFSVGRHLEIAVVADHLHKQALVGLAGDGHAFGGEKLGTGIERQATLRITRLRRMALGTVLHEQRPHLRLEEFKVFGAGGRCLATARHRLGPDVVGRGMPDDQCHQRDRRQRPRQRSRQEGVKRTTFGRA